MSLLNVTDRVDFAEIDDELLPITKCVCSTVFKRWDFVISVYEDTAYECPACHRKFIFSNKITVYEVIPDKGKS